MMNTGDLRKPCDILTSDFRLILYISIASSEEGCNLIGHNWTPLFRS